MPNFLLYLINKYLTFVVLAHSWSKMYPLFGAPLILMYFLIAFSKRRLLGPSLIVACSVSVGIILDLDDLM